MLALEVRLLFLVVKGPGSLFPTFFFFMFLSAVSQALFIVHLYTAFMFVQVMATPIKIWAAWEAVSLLFRYVSDATPKNERGELYWLCLFCIGFAILFVSVLGDAPMQYNASNMLNRIKTTVQMVIIAALLVPVAYAMFREPKAPPRSRNHLLLLFAWFLISIVNLIPVGQGQGDRWEFLNALSGIAWIAVLAGWVRLFRSRTQQSYLAPNRIQPAGVFFVLAVALLGVIAMVRL